VDDFTDWDQFIASALPVVDWMFTGERYRDVPERTPVLRLGASGRPDVQDLARVLLTEEGAGRRSLSEWFSCSVGGQSAVVLDALFTSPVTCPVRVLFSLPRHRSVLDAVVATGYLAITTEPFEGVPGSVLWAVSMAVPTEALKDCLAGGRVTADPTDFAFAKWV
jgi:hypothetical protein